MPYVLSGPKWGSPTYGTTATITWSFADLNLDPGLREDYQDYPDITGNVSAGFRDVIRVAFSLWSAVTGLTFIENGDSESNDIRIGAETIDGNGPILGQATYWYQQNTFLKVAIAFDVDSFTDHFYSTALHEIGHAIGLDHSSSSFDVMYAYAGSDNINGLSIDDMAGARALYTDGLTLQGTSSDDALSSGSGADLIFGKEGADTINAGEGGNIIVGGTGPIDGGDVISAGSGNDIFYGNGGNDTISSSGGKDIAVGGFGADLISLGAGNDIIYGNQNNDTINAGDGSNLIYGGQGDDVITSGSGIDNLWGNEGNDILTGGAGADLYAFQSGSGADQINAFNSGEGDRLDLQGQNFSLSSSGDGDALLLLSGGGTIELNGVAPDTFSSAFVA